MTTYTYTTVHHSIARHWSSTAKTLAGAKRLATRNMGNGFAGHKLVISDDRGNIVSTRTLPAGKWQDR